MTFLKKLQKNFKSHHFIALVGILVLSLAIMQYTNRKTNYADGFGNGNSLSPSGTQGSASVAGSAAPAVPATEKVGQNEIYSDVPNGSTTNTHGLSPVARANANYDPRNYCPRMSTVNGHN